MTWFEIYALLAPLQMVGLALIILAVTHWQDKRDQRRAARE